jgi:hypothetical protein
MSHARRLLGSLRLASVSVMYRRGFAEGERARLLAAAAGAMSERVPAFKAQHLTRRLALRPCLDEGDEPNRAQAHFAPLAGAPVHHYPARRAAWRHLQIEAFAVREHAGCAAGDVDAMRRAVRRSTRRGISDASFHGAGSACFTHAQQIAANDVLSVDARDLLRMCDYR